MKNMVLCVQNSFSDSCKNYVEGETVIEFGKPVSLAPGLMAMWGDRESCTVPFFSDRAMRSGTEGFALDAEQKRRTYGLESLWFFKQEHTVDGRVVTSDMGSGVHLIVDQDGDYFITNVSKVGIGVGTADCLPILFFDPVQRVVAVAHAGWKGSVQGIAPIVVRRLQQDFGSQPCDVRVWFGPSAKVCCYEVQEGFQVNLFHDFVSQTIEQREKKLFFSNVKYNELLLLQAEIVENNIDIAFNSCTICSPSFHSRRNDGALYVGQSSIAWLI